jgi:DNA-binding MarR family transcriptional regulator
MTIEELAKLKANSMPNSILVKYYEAGIPQWHMEAILTMLKPKKLSVLQEFILKFTSSGIDDISDICKFLGVNKSAVNNAVAILQKNSLITVDIFYSKLKLTDKGEKALKEAATIVPEDIEYALYVDGLIGNVYLDIRKLYTSKELRNFEIKPINTTVEKPTLDTLVYEDVKRAINLFKKNHEYEKDKLEGDLQEVSRVVKTYVEYKKVYVLVFLNNKSEDIEFQVYDGVTRNDDYSIALQKQYNNNTRVLDLDSIEATDEEAGNSLINVLPQEIIENAKSFSYKDSTLEREISNLSTQLDAIKDNSDEEEQKESATERIRFLEKKIDEIKNERKGADRILSTYDHRPLLLDALDNAQNTVVIVSPWIKSGGLNNEILGRIERALQKRIQVIIGYGISKKEDSDKWVLQRLSDIQKKRYGKNLHLVRLCNTHEKVLIKDNEYMVITSFNWLSFKGDPDKGFRQETGYYTESKDAIKQMKENLSNRMSIKI